MGRAITYYDAFGDLIDSSTYDIATEGVGDFFSDMLEKIQSAFGGFGDWIKGLFNFVEKDDGSGASSESKEALLNRLLGYSPRGADVRYDTQEELKGDKIKDNLKSNKGKSHLQSACANANAVLAEANKSIDDLSKNLTSMLPVIKVMCEKMLTLKGQKDASIRRVTASDSTEQAKADRDARLKGNVQQAENEKIDDNGAFSIFSNGKQYRIDEALTEFKEYYEKYDFRNKFIKVGETVRVINGKVSNDFAPVTGNKHLDKETKGVNGETRTIRQWYIEHVKKSCREKILKHREATFRSLENFEKVIKLLKTSYSSDKNSSVTKALKGVSDFVNVMFKDLRQGFTTLASICHHQFERDKDGNDKVNMFSSEEREKMKKKQKAEEERQKREEGKPEKPDDGNVKSPKQKVIDQWDPALKAEYEKDLKRLEESKGMQTLTGHNRHAVEQELKRDKEELEKIKNRWKHDMTKMNDADKKNVAKLTDNIKENERKLNPGGGESYSTALNAKLAKFEKENPKPHPSDKKYDDMRNNEIRENKRANKGKKDPNFKPLKWRQNYDGDLVAWQEKRDKIIRVYQKDNDRNKSFEQDRYNLYLKYIERNKRLEKQNSYKASGKYNAQPKPIPK